MAFYYQKYRILTAHVSQYGNFIHFRNPLANYQHDLTFENHLDNSPKLTFNPDIKFIALNKKMLRKDDISARAFNYYTLILHYLVKELLISFSKSPEEGIGAKTSTISKFLSITKKRGIDTIR